MTKSQLIATLVGIALAPPLIVVGMNADNIFVEDRQAGSLLYFTANH